ncbi:MAG: hypothetical protein HWN67_22025, partial [Candidatus Helarchaeota archaeon]|nr:hypothetical protein [Candidatus Helarchaeota archaeon]
KPVIKPIPKPVIKPKPKPVIKPKPTKVPEEVKKLNQEKENIQFKIKLLAKQYKKGEISGTVFKNVLKKLEGNMKKLDEQIESSS